MNSEKLNSTMNAKPPHAGTLKWGFRGSKPQMQLKCRVAIGAVVNQVWP